ncbi:MAG TPA: TolC family protein, partial [Desulfohalobiaceae bacterium]|nr:TolC family protein [Desulfohalobiaceae bacterium]
SEVEDAMTGYIEQQTRLKALKDSVQASTRYLHLAEKLYKDGLSDFQNVLDAQRELFLAEDNLDKAKGNSAQYIVTLYKALGGGWDPETRKSGVYAMEKKGKEKIEKTIKGDQG